MKLHCLRWHSLSQTLRLVCLTSLAMVVMLLAGGWMMPAPAQAAIREVHEAPNQVLYQSRQALRDRQGNTWQAIMFKRVKPDESFMALRLVGFPGVASVDRSRPLVLINTLNEQWTLEDASSKIFTDENSPEPNVGQYNIGDIIADLDPVAPLRLEMPTESGEPIQLTITPPLLQEWKRVSERELS